MKHLRLPARLADSLVGLEIFTAWLSASWAVLLFFPGDTFETTPAYRLLMPMGETTWAFLALSISALKVTGIIMSFYTFGAMFRIIAAGASFGFWTTLGLLLFLGNPLGHGWVIYTSLGAANVLFFIVHILTYRANVDGRPRIVRLKCRDYAKRESRQP